MVSLNEAESSDPVRTYADVEPERTGVADEPMPQIKAVPVAKVNAAPVANAEAPPVAIIAKAAPAAKAKAPPAAVIAMTMPLIPPPLPHAIDVKMELPEVDSESARFARALAAIGRLYQQL